MIHISSMNKLNCYTICMLLGLYFWMFSQIYKKWKPFAFTIWFSGWATYCLYSHNLVVHSPENLSSQSFIGCLLTKHAKWNFVGLLYFMYAFRDNIVIKWCWTWNSWSIFGFIHFVLHHLYLSIIYDWWLKWLLCLSYCNFL